MKRFALLFLTLCMLCASLLLPVAAETEETAISIDLTEATDEQLADLLVQVQQEIRSRIKTVIVLDMTEATVFKGKQLKLNAEVTGLSEGVTVTKTSWTTSDKAIATVQNGNVVPVDPGDAVITCTSELSDGTEIYAECMVAVRVAVANISIAKQSIELELGESYQPEVTFQPRNASNTVLRYESDDPDIVSVDEATGEVVACGVGRCKITATTTDGSEKKATFMVHVPSFAADEKKITVTEKDGIAFSAFYYGESEDNIRVSFGNASIADCSYSFDARTGELTFEVYPIRAGQLTVSLTDKADAASKLQLNVTIDHSAVYDQQSYPVMKYDDAFRYPDKYEGKTVSFSGKVQQVIDGYLTKSYRISSRGSYKDVVYVDIPVSKITTPILEDDRVTVYGVYDGNYTYSSIWGQSITIPSVEAERIIITKK